MATRWVRKLGFVCLGLRLPLYDGGKLDLLAIARCFNFYPAGLSVRVILRQKQDDDDEDDAVAFHPLPLDYTTGLSRLTWDELAEEVRILHGVAFPNGSTQDESAVFDGSAWTGDVPHWLPALCTRAGRRGVVGLESLICHRFGFVFRVYLQVDRFANVSDDKNLSDILPDREPYPLEEDTYMDRHLPPASCQKLLDCVSQYMPQSYHWLQQEDIAKHRKVFPVRMINLDVEVKSRSTAVLAHGRDAVLGIDIVSEITQAALNWCEMEFYLWATSSSLPHLQIITDHKNGAVALYCKGDGVLAAQAMSVDALKAFLRVVATTLPLDAFCSQAWSVLARKRIEEPRKEQPGRFALH